MADRKGWLFCNEKHNYKAWLTSVMKRCHIILLIQTFKSGELYSLPARFLNAWEMHLSLFHPRVGFKNRTRGSRDKAFVHYIRHSMHPQPHSVSRHSEAIPLLHVTGVNTNTKPINYNFMDHSGANGGRCRGDGAKIRSTRFVYHTSHSSVMLD